MSGLKETRERIKSVKNTKKITYAMKLVSAAKLGKAQDAAKNFSEYNNELASLVSQALQAMGDDANEQSSHPLTEVRDEVKRIGVLVIGASRGLCGPFNTSVNKVIDSFLAEQTAEVSVTVMGKKPAEHCRAQGIEVEKTYEGLPDNPNDWPLEEVLASLRTQFQAGELDEVYVIYTEFRSALSMTAKSEKILPLELDTEVEEASASATLFEPCAKEVFSALLPRVVASKVRRAALDSKAGEHASRMTAMDAATKNAGELIDDLTLKYNKARQNAITSDMLDIVGGAEALND